MSPRAVLPRPRARALVASAVIATGVLSAVPPATGGPLGPDTAAAATKKQPAKKTKKPKRPKYTVEGELRKLRAARTISATDLRTWRTLYRDAQAKATALPKGTRRTELLEVLESTDEIAGRRQLTASLAPSVFLTLQVNRDWWTGTAPTPAPNSRPLVPGSPLTWQYYRGEGLQIQWLATFGTANALATTNTPAKLETLRAIQDEAVRLASDRAGGPSWQYLFDFGGGAPPWGSAMAQVTGMQSLVRAAGKLGNASYRTTALEAVGLLRRTAPTGARLKQPGGDHLLLYTFTKMRVLNAFTQAVSGLHEVAAATGDTKVAATYVRAERQLRAELPEYDLGNWARYSAGGKPETPSYHTLSRDLLRGLCRTLGTDAVAFSAGQPVAGGLPPAPAAPYCALGERFAQDLVLTPSGPKAGARAATRSGRVATPAPVADPAATLGSPALTRP